MNKLAIKKWDELEDRVPAHAIVADDNCAQVEVGCQAHNHFDVAGATASKTIARSPS
jgi:hypothetical protein